MTEPAPVGSLDIAADLGLRISEKDRAARRVNGFVGVDRC
jgi:hypothetical protein